MKLVKENSSNCKIQKPFLKWVGGKTSILHHILSKIPKEMKNYHEMFVGGGSVLLGVLSLQKQGDIKIYGKIYAYDINNDLIDVYKNIQYNKEELYKYIVFYRTEYDSIQGDTICRNPENLTQAKTSKESYYYWIRNQYNTMKKKYDAMKNIDFKKKVEYCALFIFLNKTCFRGMYREGPHGFNVPYGHYKKTPTILSKTELDCISELLQNVEFQQGDFRNTMENIQPGDFAYFDPPYVPENTKSFVGYVVDGFNLETHQELFRKIKKLVNVQFILSNAKVKFVMDHFNEYHHEEIIVRRSIHSKKPNTKTSEVIIYNK